MRISLASTMQDEPSCNGCGKSFPFTFIVNSIASVVAAFWVLFITKIRGLGKLGWVIIADLLSCKIAQLPVLTSETVCWARPMFCRGTIVNKKAIVAFFLFKALGKL